MDAHSVVDDWEAAPFDGGFGGLDRLASRGFSGAVEANGTWLFLRDGDALAVVSDLESNPRPGDIDAFEDASGRRYEAPNGPVATLTPMLALDGEVRGRYFTDDTPLSAVDETLSGGGFTGYVELSENVLSGEYYFVYVDGEVEHVGFVGSAQLLTGEDAERKAADEVGIYAVVAVELPRPELPDPPEPEPEPEPDAESTAVETDAPGDPADGDDPAVESDEDSSGDSEADSTQEPDSDPDADADADTGADADRTGPEPKPEATSDATAADSGPETEAPNGTAESTPAPTDSGTATASADGDVRTRPSSGRSTEQARTETADTTDEDSDVDTSPPAPDRSPADPSDRIDSASEEPRTTPPAGDDGGIDAVTTKTVPSLDPENSGRADSGAERPKRRQPDRTDSSGATAREESRSSAPSESSRPSQSDRFAEQREEYESKIETYESRIEELESELGDAESRIEELESELETLRAERDELRAELDAADGAADETVESGGPVGPSLTPIDALSGTSLFIRETRRGDATLEDARDGGTDRETVAENLRIEYHTEFEDEGATVDGEPFEAWLRSSDTYTFVEWLLTELFFEIRSTGAIDGLEPLYTALPEIDRVGFEETIAVGDGEERREVEFDIVARNKKGDPVLVVAFDRQRDPTRAEAIEPLVNDASDVCLEYDSLAGAVAITSSYFESDARAAAEEATSTSLLSRSKYRSYVKLSRSSGYHLCLAEFRDGSFNLTHPEL